MEFGFLLVQYKDQGVFENESPAGWAPGYSIKVIFFRLIFTEGPDSWGALHKSLRGLRGHRRRCLCIAFVTEDSGADPGSAGGQVLLGVLGCDPLDAISGKGTPCQVRVSASCTSGRAGQAVVARGDAALG